MLNTRGPFCDVPRSNSPPGLGRRKTPPSKCATSVCLRKFWLATVSAADTRPESGTPVVRTAFPAAGNPTDPAGPQRRQPPAQSDTHAGTRRRIPPRPWRRPQSEVEEPRQVDVLTPRVAVEPLEHLETDATQVETGAHRAEPRLWEYEAGRSRRVLAGEVLPAPHAGQPEPRVAAARGVGRQPRPDRGTQPAPP